MKNYDPRLAAYEDQTRVSGLVYMVMLVIMVAFGGLIWNLYSGGEAPRFAAPSGAYKSAPPAEAANAPDLAEQSAFMDSLEGARTEPAATPAPAPEAPLAAPAAGPPRLTAPPRFVANGPFVAQVAALQSEVGVDTAWQRLASRSPDLFSQARLDVERADLGARGTYYRIRAGYFADRDNATRFCDRIAQMGQDCIVVSR